MKKSIGWILSALFLGLTGFAWAQSDMNDIPKQRAMTESKNLHVSHLQQVKSRIGDQTKKINDGVQSKILSAAEGKKFNAKLASIKKELGRYMKKNGKRKDLTKEQQARLNEMLNENSKAINGDDLDDAAPAKPSAAGE